jgi:hypothetical protein
MKCKVPFVSIHNKLILFINFTETFAKEDNERNAQQDNQWRNGQVKWKEKFWQVRRKSEERRKIGNNNGIIDGKCRKGNPEKSINKRDLKSNT